MTSPAAVGRTKDNDVRDIGGLAQSPISLTDGIFQSGLSNAVSDYEMPKGTTRHGRIEYRKARPSGIIAEVIKNADFVESLKQLSALTLDGRRLVLRHKSGRLETSIKGPGFPTKPNKVSFASTKASRSLIRWNFCCQNSTRVFGSMHACIHHGGAITAT